MFFPHIQFIHIDNGQWHFSKYLSVCVTARVMLSFIYFHLDFIYRQLRLPNNGINCISASTDCVELCAELKGDIKCIGKLQSLCRLSIGSCWGYPLCGNRRLEWHAQLNTVQWPLATSIEQFFCLLTQLILSKPKKHKSDYLNWLVSKFQPKKSWALIAKSRIC